MAVYGYARVSTDGQSLAAQLGGTESQKCTKIFQEKISGARSDRKQLARLMGAYSLKAMYLLSPGLTGWHALPAISSTCWARSPRRAPVSNP
jgi:hypothetical protein